MNLTDHLIEETLDKLAAVAIDITAPQHVEVVADIEGKVLWVNINGICVLRCCRIQNLNLGNTPVIRSN